MFIFCLLQDLVDGVQYKVNITALVEDDKDYKNYKVTDSKRPESVRMSVEPSTAVESKALHEKVSLSLKVSGSFVRHMISSQGDCNKRVPQCACGRTLRTLGTSDE